VNARIKGKDFTQFRQRRKFAEMLSRMFPRPLGEVYYIKKGTSANWRIEMRADWLLTFTGHDTFCITHRYPHDADIAALIAWLAVVHSGVEVIDNE